uniref:Uncharacterized protein n=1 Tax=Setaria italica TaxID=4555 RepID=K4ANH3_SETIT
MSVFIGGFGWNSIGFKSYKLSQSRPKGWFLKFRLILLSLVRGTTKFN